MASQLDRALDEIIQDRPKRSANRGRRDGNTGGIRKRPSRPNFHTPQTRAPDRRQREADREWTHDLFESRSIASRLGSRVGGRTSDVEITVENLHYEVTEKDLEELFSLVGPIDKMKIVYDRSGRSTGVGHVKFTTASDAEKAIRKYNNVALDGQTMRIEMRTFEPRPTRNDNSTGERSFRAGRSNRTFRGRGRGGRNRERDSRPHKSSADLDEEMDAYMTNTSTANNEDITMSID